MQFTNTAHAQRMPKTLYNTLSMKRKISTIPSLKCRIFCQVYSGTGGEVLGVRVRLRQEAAIADGGLQAKHKTEGSPKLQRGPQAAGENSTRMQRQGGNSFRAVPSPELPRDALSVPDPRGTADSGPGSPGRAGASGAAPPLPGLRPRIRPAWGFLPRNRAAPPPRPHAGAFPKREDSKREQPPPLDRAKPPQPRGGCSPRAAPAARPALPGSAGPAASATHPLWRAGWTCTRRRRGWRRWSPAAAAASPASCELSSA